MNPDQHRRRLADYKQQAARIVEIGESHGYSVADRIAISLQSAYMDGLDDAKGDGNEVTAPGTVLCFVVCPDCGEEVPVGVRPGELVDGNLEVETDLSDVWAHAFTHDGASE